MDFDTEYIIQRIVSGFYYTEVDGVTYQIKLPRLAIRQRAYYIYKSIIENNKYDISWYSDSTINNFLKIYSLWNKSKEDYLNKLNEDLKKAKIELFLKFTDSKTRQTIKNIIEGIVVNISKLHYDKNYFYFLSLEQYAQSIKNQFIIANMVYHNDELVFNTNIDCVDSRLLEKFILEINNNTLSISDIKTVARSELWKSFWHAGKETVFSPPISDWTEEQILLVNLSKTYDSIKEHPECPTDEIINDDDALDGWMFFQHDKQEKEKKKQMINDKYSLKNKGGDEVFLLTSSLEESKEIFGLNDPHTLKNIKEIREASRQDSSTPWSQLPHVQRELQLKQKEMVKNKLHGNN